MRVRGLWSVFTILRQKRAKILKDVEAIALALDYNATLFGKWYDIPYSRALLICSSLKSYGKLPDSELPKPESVKKDTTSRRFEDYPNLVQNIVKSFKLPHLAEDLYQEAWLIWEKQAPRYDPTKGCSFNTYIGNMLRHRLRDFLREQDHVPRIARHKASAYEKAKTNLQHILGQKLSDYTIEQITGFSCEHLHNMESYGILPYNHPVAIAYDEGSITEYCKNLSMEDKTILYLYYEKGQTMATIGKVLHLSESRVSQKHSQLIEILRERHGLVHG